MATPILIRTLLIGAAAIAVTAVPTASADSGTECDRSTRCVTTSPSYSPGISGAVQSVPQGWSNEAQFARPDYNPFGAGPYPPLIALDD